MKMTRKWVALFICVAMLAALCITVSAAGGETNLSAEITATTAEIGDQITLTISNGDMNVRSIKAGFYFDNTKLQVNKITWEDIIAYSEEEEDDVENGAASKTAKKKANTDGSALGVYAINSGVDSDCYEGVIVTVIFDVIAEGDAEITLREESVGVDAFKSDSVETITITIGSSEPAHTCSLEWYQGLAATCNAPGYEGFYQCSDETCGKIYKDDAGQYEINMADWATGEGYLAPTGLHADADNDDDHKCDVCGTDNISEHEYMYPCDPYCCICHELTNPEATHSITHVEAKPGTDCQTYDGHMEYWTCSHCGGVWTDENLMSPTNMMNIKVNGEHTYTYDCDTYCKVCEQLTRPEAKHEGGTATCVTKAVCQYCETAYGELAPTNHAGTAVTYINNGDTHSATYDCCGGDYVTNEPHDYKNNYECVCGAKFTGWDTEIDGEDDVTVHTFYVINGVRQYSGWTKIDGDWYYLSTTSGYRAEGLSRVPYNTALGHSALAEDLAYNPNFIDAESALYYFDSEGKYEITKNGIIDGKYVVNGMIPWHPGFVTVENELYYFVGDKENGGNKLANGEIYVTRNAGAAGYTKGDRLTFVDGKVKTDLDGIVNGCYYEEGKLMAGAGLVKIEDGKYIYVRSTGQVVVNADYYIPANDLGVVSTKYTFDANGILQNPKFTNVNGIVDGYYYVNGKLNYAGLIEIDDEIYYINSEGKVVTGTYYVTKTNGIDLGTNKLFFGEDGKMEDVKNGIVKEGAKYYYYENNHLAYGKGVVKMTDEAGDTYYIYVRSNGELATGKYWPTTRNGYLESGEYDWGTDGKYYPAK